ncbi:MAG: hypothetical protein A2049_04480 [Elusimicrobia bacterium GWA2_62_23]|nr:MAG: hypothetical protein A2049_04480 [Elusimicrobia bacterium GWA2_62_23]
MKTLCSALFFAAIFAAVPAAAADTEDTLRAQLKSASTPEARRAIMDQIKQARAVSRPAAAPAAQADPAARRARMEESLKDDPERLAEFRLQESLRAARTPEDRAAIRKQLEEKRAARAAKAEAALTPEQKAVRAQRAAQAAAMRAEMQPLRERLRAAATEAERDSAREALRAVQEKYRAKP